MIDTKSIRAKILDLAMRGQLTEQLSEDGSAEELYQQIQIEKQARINAGTIKKSKPLSEVTAEEIPFEIPESWKWVRVGSITEIAGGTTPSASEISSSGTIPYYKVSDMNTPGNEKQMIYASNYISEGYTGKIFPAGTTIFPKNGGAALTNKRRVLTVPSAIDLNTGGCTPLLYEMANWIRLFMETVDFGKMDTGSNIPTVNATNLKSQLMTLPPLAEQQRIVERIEQAFSVLDTIDTLQAQYADNFTVLKSKLIDAAIQGKLTEQLPEDGTAEELYQSISEKKKEMQKRKEIKNSKPLPEIAEDEIPFEIPSNWKWVHLDDITTKITSGSTPAGGRKSNAYVESGNCFFREQNIYNDGIHEEGMVYITDELLSIRENSTVIAKDILLNITGGSIGRCALIPDDFGKGSINQHILIIRMVDERLRFYIHKLLCSPYAQRYIKDKSVGDKDGFSGGRCKQMLIPIPPLAEQQRIAEKIDEVLSAISMAG